VQPATKRIGTPPRSNACCGAPNRLLNALSQLREEKNWDAEGGKEVVGRQLRPEVARISGCSMLLRKEVAARRGASAKRSLSEEVAQQRKVARPPIHSFIHPSLHLFVHSFSH